MKELLYCWMSTTLEVLVPKRRGDGFVRTPLGHHHDDGLADIERLAGCDLFGLDGALSFDARRDATYEEKRAAFVARVLPALERHYCWSSREISRQQFWELHPQSPHDA